VLEQVHSAVSERARSAPTPARRRDRLTSWLLQTGEGMKRQSTDIDEVKALQVELDHVVEEFQVMFDPAMPSYSVNSAIFRRRSQLS
jgi:hypothetical protein